MADKYCTKTHLDDMMGEGGILGRMDDNEDGGLSIADSDRIDRMIERASAEAAMHLRQMPTERVEWKGADPPNDTPVSVQWLTAAIALYYVLTHRGNPIPQQYLGDYQQALVTLEKLGQGKMKLDDVNYTFNVLPTVSNMTVQGIFDNAKVRVLDSISSGGRPQSGTTKRNEAFEHHYFH